MRTYTLLGLVALPSPLAAQDIGFDPVPDWTIEVPRFEDRQVS